MKDFSHIPIVATLRDSQNYIKAAELGVGIHEMKPYLVREDVEQWESLTQWIEQRAAPAMARQQAGAGVADEAPGDANLVGVTVAGPVPTTS